MTSGPTEKNYITSPSAGDNEYFSFKIKPVDPSEKNQLCRAVLMGLKTKANYLKINVKFLLSLTYCCRYL